MISRILRLILFLTIMMGCTTKESIEPPPSDIDKESLSHDALLWVFKPNVNIRESASASAKKLISLADGDSVLVLENVEGWYQIKTLDGQSGWIRSDLLGPKDLSAFGSAVTFVENLKENDNIEVYFDKKLYHKRIYISYPSDLYSSRQAVETKTKEIVQDYQNKVYRGTVTARVLKAGSEEEYLTLEVKGAINAEPILPIVPFGRIEDVDRSNSSGIKLIYSVPADISDNQLITTARDIVPKFPISYQSVEIVFKDSPYSAQKSCRLWYMEDKNGEEFKVGECE